MNEINHIVGELSHEAHMRIDEGRGITVDVDANPVYRIDGHDPLVITRYPGLAGPRVVGRLLLTGFMNTEDGPTEGKVFIVGKGDTASYGFSVPANALNDFAEQLERPDLAVFSQTDIYSNPSNL